MNKNITAIVFARNEEKRISAIYENFKNFCRIIVFDGGSSDGTEEFCKNNNIKFVLRPEADSWEDRNKLNPWVFENTPTEYIIMVYGSHFYPKPLLETFGAIANENKKVAVYHDVVIYRYGEVVHRPIIRRIASACVFFKKSLIKVDTRRYKIHAELSFEFDKNSMVRLPGRDELSLHLFQDEDCESFTKKTINYEVIEAKQRFAAGERMSGIGLFVGPIRRFIYQYFRTGSFIRGSKGLIYSILNLIYDFNTSIILWELTNQVTYHDAIKKNANKRAQLLNNFFINTKKRS